MPPKPKSAREAPADRLVRRWALAVPGGGEGGEGGERGEAGREGDERRVRQAGRAMEAHRRAARIVRHLQPPLEPTGPARRSDDHSAAPTLTVSEPARELPVLLRCRVLVVGGGPAGLSAALAAKRALDNNNNNNNSNNNNNTGPFSECSDLDDVVLMERFGCFGGVISTVGMETLGWYRYGDAKSNDSLGIGREMERVAKRMGATSPWPFNDSECLNGEKFKIVADRLVSEAGVRPLLHCWAAGVVLGSSSADNNDDNVVAKDDVGGSGEEEGGDSSAASRPVVIRGVITESKSGRAVVLADRVVDCTGDADIAAMAGCDFTTLPVGQRMGSTTVFNAVGVDKSKFMRHIDENAATYADWSGSENEWKQETTGKEDDLKSPFLASEFKAAADKGVISREDAKGMAGSWSALSDNGEATNLNLAHVPETDCLDVLSLTRAEMDGRRRSVEALKALNSTLPGFERAELRNFGMTHGVRDTRKIVGQYNLTSGDVRNQARFEDSVGIFPEFIDGYSILILPTTGRYFHLPLRCCIPAGQDGAPSVGNLLVAGRCVAGDKTSHAAMRNMMACTVTGQGSGTAAAVSLLSGCPTGRVESYLKPLRTELERQGVRLS